MKRDPNDPAQPMVGDSFGTLGVRVPKDIQPTPADRVSTRFGGMSVSLSPEGLPAGFRRDHPVWRMYEEDLPASLYLAGAPTGERNRDHALVEPSRDMTMTEYRAALARTQSFWEEVPTWPNKTPSDEPSMQEE